MWESTQAWWALQKSSQVWQASLNNFKSFECFQLCRRCSLNLLWNEGQFRLLVARKSKNHWQNTSFPSLFMRFALDCWKSSRHNCAGHGVNLQHRQGLSYLPCYCQSYPYLGRHRHVIIYLLDSCAKILSWIYVFGKKLLVDILSAGIWAVYSMATKSRVSKDTGSSLSVLAERAGGEISL